MPNDGNIGDVGRWQPVRDGVKSGRGSRMMILNNRRRRREGQVFDSGLDCSSDDNVLRRDQVLREVVPFCGR